jgi:MerR family redox-sensitive transcriptional activator SoxR
MSMQKLTIGAVAHQAGVRTSALRYYEEIGLLPPPARINGQRRYDASVFQTLGLIHVAQQAGFTVAEIQILLNSILKEPTPSLQWQALAQQKLEEVEKRLSAVQSMKRLLEEVLRCDYPRLIECICDVGERYGVLGGEQDA